MLLLDRADSLLANAMSGGGEPPTASTDKVSSDSLLLGRTVDELPFTVSASGTPGDAVPQWTETLNPTSGMDTGVGHIRDDTSLVVLSERCHFQRSWALSTKEEGTRSFSLLLQDTDQRVAALRAGSLEDLSTKENMETFGVGTQSDHPDVAKLCSPSNECYDSRPAAGETDKEPTAQEEAVLLPTEVADHTDTSLSVDTCNTTLVPSSSDWPSPSVVPKLATGCCSPSSPVVAQTRSVD